MEFNIEVDKRLEQFESVNRKEYINNDKTIEYFEKIKRKLINQIRSLSQDSINVIEVVMMQDFKDVDFDYLKQLCDRENIKMRYNIIGYSAVIHAEFDLIESRNRIKEKFDSLERKLV